MTTNVVKARLPRRLVGALIGKGDYAKNESVRGDKGKYHR